MLMFSRTPVVFPEQKCWGAVLAERWTFSIVHQPEIGYTATWKDTLQTEPHQAVPIGVGFRSLGAAKRACETRAARLAQ